MNRLDPEALKLRLKQAGVWSKKSFGQHFLIDEKALLAMVETPNIQPGERVFEIGPGPGVLTEKLLEAGAAVTAFEADPDMVKILLEDFPMLNLVQGNALTTIPRLATEHYKVVANIPYQITTPLIALFLEGGVPRLPESITILVQKEVGERLAAPARTGERGFLSVLVQYYADVSIAAQVPNSSFWPAPEVDSVVLHMVVKPVRPLSADQEKDFFRYVKRAFLGRRKQLKNVMGGMRGVSHAEIAEQFKALGLSENVRAQELTEEEWLKLYNAHV
ncbi:MAG TPA: 16S rRNA (adenine(1518)-N(6)/adenine(1519)-N(6))-dimethyltransferase RsmA [Verrucomicrobiae bacterium]|nr:16S rRNA (adenine(1518)-N(6)/adenine(1519)-N(6))-dimethyltransferase RsmA [Verrucomicrobiae bacterium]